MYNRLNYSCVFISYFLSIHVYLLVFFVIDTHAWIVNIACQYMTQITNRCVIPRNVRGYFDVRFRDWSLYNAFAKYLLAEVTCHTHTHTNTHKCTDAHACMVLYAGKCTCLHARKREIILTPRHSIKVQTQTHARARAHTHTHTHTHTQYCTHTKKKNISAV